METADERRQRVARKAKRHFLFLVAFMVATSIYIAYFAGDSFLAASENAPTD